MCLGHCVRADAFVLTCRTACADVSHCDVSRLRVALRCCVLASHCASHCVCVASSLDASPHRFAPEPETYLLPPRSRSRLACARVRVRVRVRVCLSCARAKSVRDIARVRGWVRSPARLATRPHSRGGPNLQIFGPTFFILIYPNRLWPASILCTMSS